MSDLVGNLAVPVTRGGGLQKLVIAPTERLAVAKAVTAMFNPTELSRRRSLRWQQKGVVGGEGEFSWINRQQSFLAMEAETLSITLVFDSYGLSPTDVRAHTSKVAALSMVDPKLHRPPVCELSWGAFKGIFRGVLTGFGETFTLFLRDGTPVRASVACDFVEFRTEAHADVRKVAASTRKVRSSESLQDVAATEYGDAADWRPIAKANGIVNPRARSGGQLRIPARGVRR